MPLLLFSYFIALPGDYDVDEPRNLAKSHTSEQDHLDRPWLTNSVTEIVEPANLSSRRRSTAAKEDPA